MQREDDVKVSPSAPANNTTSKAKFYMQKNVRINKVNMVDDDDETLDPKGDRGRRAS